MNVVLENSCRGKVDAKQVMLTLWPQVTSGPSEPMSAPPLGDIRERVGFCCGTEEKKKKKIKIIVEVPVACFFRPLGSFINGLSKIISLVLICWIPFGWITSFCEVFGLSNKMSWKLFDGMYIKRNSSDIHGTLELAEKKLTLRR